MNSNIADKYDSNCSMNELSVLMMTFEYFQSSKIKAAFRRCCGLEVWPSFYMVTFSRLEAVGGDIIHQNSKGRIEPEYSRILIMDHDVESKS